MHMQVFLQELFARVQTAEIPDDTFSPQDKVEEGEVILGTLNDELKKLFVIIESLRSEMNKRLGSMKTLMRKLSFYPEHCSAEEKKIIREYVLECERLPIIQDLFWQMLKESMPETTFTKSPGLREGWKVVKTRAEDSGCVIIFNRSQPRSDVCGCGGCGGCGCHSS